MVVEAREDYLEELKVNLLAVLEGLVVGQILVGVEVIRKEELEVYQSLEEVVGDLMLVFIVQILEEEEASLFEVPVVVLQIREVVEVSYQAMVAVYFEPVQVKDSMMEV